MRIKELILDKKESTVYCESFVYEPSNVEEEKFGRLFMVGRIRNVPDNSFYLVNLLASRIKREYYNLRHQSSYNAFDEAMKEANKVLKENEERINWLGNLDFLVAMVDEKKIYFTLMGKMKCLILRENQVLDLVKDMIMEKDVLFPFSTMLEGNIKENDILILATSNIFSKETLINEGQNLFPIDEGKIAKFINPDESGVSLVVETGQASGVIERLTPTLEILKPPMSIPKINLPQKEKLKAGAKKGKEFIKNIASKGKGVLGPKMKQIGGSIQERKESVAPRIAVEKMHYSQKLRKNFSKIFKKKGIALVILAVVILGLVFGITQYKKSSQIKLVNKVIAEAKAKESESENYLVYGDKEKAIKVLSEALDSLNSIKTNIKKEEVGAIKKEIEGKIAEISGRKILTDIAPLFEVKTSEKTGTAAWQGNGIVLDGANFYVYSSASASMYKWNAEDKSGDFIKEKAKVLGGTIVNEKNFFLLSPTSVVISEKEKTFSLDLPYENATITQINGYLNYLYVLDGKEGEVIKYKVSDTAIDAPSLWLKKRNDVKNAVSFTVDGNIYLLYSDGKIKRFSNGSLKEEIASPKTYPAVKSAIKVFTSADNKYLYIADPQQKRIIVEDKKGSIVAEYQSDKFENIKDVWASAQDKNIYILANNKIFSIEISK